MPWTKVRVHKYTRELHPDDYAKGLPAPADHTDDDAHYEHFVVRKNDTGEWIGRNGIVNNWLTQNIPSDADNAKEVEETEAIDNKPKRRTKKK